MSKIDLVIFSNAFTGFPYWPKMIVTKIESSNEVKILGKVHAYHHLSAGWKAPLAYPVLITSLHYAQVGKNSSPSNMVSKMRAESAPPVRTKIF